MGTSIIELTGKKKTTYKAIVRVAGYNTFSKNFKTKQEAKHWGKQIELDIEDGKIPLAANKVAAKIQIKTVGELIDYFKKNEAPSRYADPEKYNTMYDWWVNKIGNIKIRELSASHIAECKRILMTEKITKKGVEVVRKANTINKYLMCISAVLTYAMNELEIIDINPKSKVKCLPKPDGRTRFLSETEIKKYLLACKEHSQMIYIFVLLGLTTGGRYSEVLNLKVENIDFKNKQVHFLNTKNKTNRGAPISKELANLISKYLNGNKIESGYIFINKKSKKPSYIRGQLLKIIKDINLSDFHIHDERHTVASYMAMSGSSLLDIAEVLGHKSLTVARRYSHLTKQHTDKQLSKAVSKMSIKY